MIMTHPLDPDDAAIVNAMRAAASSTKGRLGGIEARAPFDALMESVLPRNDVTFETETIGGVPGLWVRPIASPADDAILHLHAGWFNFGTAKAFRHLVGHIAARAGVKAFIPDYRLAPEHPFPAAVEDVVACYRGIESRGIRRIALTGDSAGGNLALVLASRATAVAVAVQSPVTDLTLSGETYETRADADPYFTRPQVAELVNSYLSGADPRDPRASPLYAQFAGLPAISVHVGDDEVLLPIDMNTLVAVLGAVIVVLLVLLAWSMGQRQRSASLRERFGPEYEHTVEEVGDRRKAEAELAARTKRVKALDIHPLTVEQRNRFAHDIACFVSLSH